MADVAHLTLRVDADDEDLKKLEVTAGKTFGAFESVLAGATAGLTNFAVNAVAGAVGSVVDFGNSILETAGQLSDLNAATGVSTDDLQRWAFAATQSGSSLDAIAGASQKLGRSLATGNKEAIQAVNALGLSLKDLAAASPAERFETVAAAIAGISDPADQAAAAVALLGKSGADLLPAIQNFSELTAQADALGIVMSEETIAAADTFGDQLDVLTTQAQAFVAQALGPILPMVADVSTALTQVLGGAITFVGDVLKDPGVTKAIGAIGDALRKAFGGDQETIVRNLGSAIIGFAQAGISTAQFLIRAWAAVESTFLLVSIAVARVAQAHSQLQSVVAITASARAEAAASANAWKAVGDRLVVTQKAAHDVAEGNSEVLQSLAGLNTALGDVSDRLRYGAESGRIAGVSMADLERNTTGAAGAFSLLGEKAKAVKFPDVAAMTPFATDITKLAKSVAAPTAAQLTPEDWIDGLIGPDAKWKTTWKSAAEHRWGLIVDAFGDPSNVPTLTSYPVSDELAKLDKKAQDESLARWQNFGADLGQTILGAIQGGGSISGAVGGFLGKQLGSKAGSAIGDWAGKAIGGSLGSAIGGIAGSVLPGLGTIAGSFLGKGLGKLFGGLFGGGESKETRKQRDEWIASTFGSVDELRKRADVAGVSLDKIFSAKKAKDLDAAIKQIGAGLEAHTAKVTAFETALGQASASGRLLGADVVKSLSQVKAGGESTKAVFKFFQEQTSRAAGGLETFLTRAAVTSQESATAITGALGAVYEDLTLQGLSSGEALARLSPSIEALAAQLQAAGYAGGAAFEALALQAAYASDEIAGPLFQAAAGLGDLLVGTANSGRLTQEMFSGLSRQVTDVWKDIEKLGKGGAAGLANLQGPLQTVWELWKDQRYAVDDATAELLTFAEESGVVGDKFRSQQDQMKLAVEKLVGKMTELVDVLSKQLPRAAETAAGQIQSHLNRIQAPTIRVPIEYEEVNAPSISTPDVQGTGIVDVTVEVDGREIAEASTRYSGQVLAPYGV
jgi:hypothetical protein